MAITLTPLSADLGGGNRKRRLTYTASFSASYATGGDTIDPTSVVNTKFVEGFRKPSIPPDFVEINGMPGGYTAEGIPGAGNNNSLLKLFGAAGAELSAGAYPAAITGDPNITITLVFPSRRM